jgi:hypothetical protein
MSNDTTAPDWLRLESVLPIRGPKNSAEPSVEEITNLSHDTLDRHYRKYVVKTSPRRKGMKLKHALAIAAGTLPRD